MKRVLFLAMTLLALGSQGWTQSGNGTSAKITLRVENWGNLQEGKIYDAAIARFEKKHPNVNVINTMTPVVSWSNYVDKWITDVAGGNAPDVINIAIEGARLAVSKNLLSPLNSVVTSSQTARDLMTQIPQSLLDGFTVDKNLYLLPNGAQTMLIVYNTKMFKDKGLPPPAANWTWDDFLKVAQKLTSGSGDSKVYGYAQQIEFFHIQPWFITNGVSLISSDYQHSNLNDPRVTQAVQYLYDLKAKYGVMPDPTGLDVYSTFANGKIAMIGAGRWPIQPWRNAGFKDFDYAPWPRNQSGGTVWGGAGWGIGANSAHKDLAFDLISEFLSLSTLRPIMDQGQQITPIASLAKDKTFLQSPPAHAQLLWEGVSSPASKPVAAPAWFLTLEPTVVRHVQQVFAGGESPSQGMAAAYSEVESGLR